MVGYFYIEEAIILVVLIAQSNINWSIDFSLCDFYE